MGMDGRFRAAKDSRECRGSLGPSGGAERCKELLNNFGTSSFSILLCLGGGEGGRRSGNMGAAAFGATVAGDPPPQTIVWWCGAGGTMEGPWRRPTRSERTRFLPNRRIIRLEVFGHLEPSPLGPARRSK